MNSSCILDLRFPFLSLHDFFRNILADVCIISNMFDIIKDYKKYLGIFFVNAKGDIKIVKFAKNF